MTSGDSRMKMFFFRGAPLFFGKPTVHGRSLSFGRIGWPTLMARWISFDFFWECFGFHLVLLNLFLAFCIRETRALRCDATDLNWRVTRVILQAQG